MWWLSPTIARPGVRWHLTERLNSREGSLQEDDRPPFDTAQKCRHYRISSNSSRYVLIRPLSRAFRESFIGERNDRQLAVPSGKGTPRRRLMSLVTERMKVLD